MPAIVPLSALCASANCGANTTSKHTQMPIARTILNVALDAAEPLSAGRRYLVEYRRVAEQLHASDPGVARTLANATFMARLPRRISNGSQT